MTEIAVSPQQYKMKFRCPNCGEVFDKAVQKGVIAQGKGGVCPSCGVKDGQANVGNFQIVKKNEQYDQPVNYNSPRM